MAISVKKNLVSSNKYGIKCPNPMEAEYITVHNTANDASAENEIEYMIRNNSEISYHFAVDDKEVIQGIPTNRNAWHCGDGNGTGNRKSIGVEICYSRSGGSRYKKAEDLAVKFIAQLLRERGWGIDRVKKHQDWSGKYCPHRILEDGRWNSFKREVEAELKGKKPASKPAPKPAPKNEKSDYKGDSIVDYLKSIGESAGFSHRAKLAREYGLTNYKGTASQNLELLEKMRGGKPAPKKPKQDKVSGIKVLGHIQIVNVAHAAFICDRPSSSNSKNLDTARKGSKWPIAGSIPGWYEIIYKGKRAYINAKYGKRV